jgi:hypothetical protein
VRKCSASPPQNKRARQVTSAKLYSKSGSRLQEHPDGTGTAVPLLSGGSRKLPESSRAIDQYSSLIEGDYSGDLRNFRDSNKSDSGQA